MKDHKISRRHQGRDDFDVAISLSVWMTHVHDRHLTSATFKLRLTGRVTDRVQRIFPRNEMLVRTRRPPNCHNKKVPQKGITKPRRVAEFAPSRDKIEETWHRPYSRIVNVKRSRNGFPIRATRSANRLEESRFNAPGGRPACGRSVAPQPSAGLVTLQPMIRPA